MDIIGIGGPEFIILLLLGAVILGPKRVIWMAREIKQSLQQIQNMTRNITKEINREFDLLENDEQLGNRTNPKTPEKITRAVDNGSQPQLPDAYKRFREDFPNEG